MASTERLNGVIRIMVVSDLHQVAKLFTLLEEAASYHRPDVLVINGDFLDIPAGGSGQLTVQDCARKLAELSVREVVFTRGNHEGEAVWEFADVFAKSERRFATLHGEEFVYGPLAVTGFPCLLGNYEPFAFDKRPLRLNTDSWLPRLLRKTGPAARTIWIAHEPPLGLHACAEWRDAIAEYQPWVFVSGHDHKSATKTGKWYHQIGKTHCVNVGQSDGDRLHFVVIDAEFDSSRPSLPSRMTVTAYPWNQSVGFPLR